jgi:hypothetical protein
MHARSWVAEKQLAVMSDHFSRATFAGDAI